MGRRITLGISSLVAVLAASAALAQSYTSAFRPATLDDKPAGAPNEVMVLGTPHLSQLPESFRPEMVDHLVDRLVDWAPTAVATEDTPGLVCDAMRRMPSRHADEYESYCYDPSVAAGATGLDVVQATAEVDSVMAEWPHDPQPSMRRKLAALFLAAGEPGSALVQWLRLAAPERRSDGILSPALVEHLNKRMARRNETDLIGARVAARAGLERLWSVDDQSTYMGELGDEEAYGKAITGAWDNDATRQRREQYSRLEKGLSEKGGLLAYYMALNDPGSAILAYRSDWGPALAEPSPEGFGRRYVSYWETRNLRMVANMREVLGRAPGTRMLAIVGASHKGYYEAYLDQMRDVQLVDVMPVLKP